jgi:hypothetical protein
MKSASATLAPHLNHVCGAEAIQSLAQDPDRPAELAWLTWPCQTARLARSHLVQAAGGPRDTYLGVLMASDLGVADQRCILMEPLGVPAGAWGRALARRMVGMMLLRLIGLDETPSALVTHPHDDTLREIFSQLAQYIPAAICYPVSGPVAPFATAVLAHRISRQIAAQRTSQASRMPFVLDLRGSSEAALTDAARTLYRTRLPVPAATMLRRIEGPWTGQRAGTA